MNKRPYVSWARFGCDEKVVESGKMPIEDFMLVLLIINDFVDTPNRTIEVCEMAGTLGSMTNFPWALLSFPASVDTLIKLLESADRKNLEEPFLVIRVSNGWIVAAINMQPRLVSASCGRASDVALSA